MIPGLIVLVFGILVVLAVTVENDWFKKLLLSIGLAILTAGLGLVTVGLPGAFLYYLGLPFAELLYGRGVMDDVGPGSWGVAIYLSLLWPLSFPVGYALAWGGFRKQTSLVKWLVFAAVLLLWVIGLTVFIVSQEVGAQ